ncbi:DEAD/DEAH box helicase [Erysipelothrix sp. HDW6C]|uniref:DEAD/DEAH box helicase n=1 Tax=Erysipelothrix sp. HDW6C TaxID=2714930 RepID=UPI0014087979|nr:DEAD/DEAH box helicase [Erysipelothrix sp. HDW6C]QIK70309.1 DEAD/DEAH box helicase [Erysipelothrix sp. HDW6C]
MKFEDLGINANILSALEAQNYTQPTPIQEKAIPFVLRGRDVLGLAQTGTGKTAAFAVPTIQRLSATKTEGKRKIRSLVLSPTRELALQIHESFENYAVNTKIRSAVIFGGVSQVPQVKALRSGVDVLVATPGRLNDLIKQKHVSLDDVEIFILDEADRMLDMGFIHDIKRILPLLPKKKQTLLFSATMPPEITEIVDSLLKNPIEVSVAPVSSAVDTVEQFVYYVDRNNKTKLLIDILKEKSDANVLVFTRTKHGADKVVRELLKHQVSAAAIHGNKSQTARQIALANFKEGKIQVLVATDIAARGIDIDELSYVINYDLSDVPETYVHRIGRTGRAGSTGVAIAFCNFEEIPLLKQIESLIRKKITVIENHDYPLIDKTVKPKKQNKKAKARAAAVKETQPRRKPKPVSKDKGAPKAGQKKSDGKASKARRGKNDTAEKKENGPYNWSNHQSKKKPRKPARKKTTV